MVDTARPSALAIDRSDRPSAIRPASRSLSSAVRWEYPDTATPFSVSRRTDTSSALGVALHDRTRRMPAALPVVTVRLASLAAYDADLLGAGDAA